MRRLFLLAALAAPAAAQAQILSVYATYSPTHLTNVETASTTTSTGVTAQYASYWSQGIGGGVTLGLLSVGPIHLGLDARGSTKRGDNGSDTALGGLRLGIKPPLFPLKPYVEAAAGYVATRTTRLALPAIVIPGVTSAVYYENHYIAYQGFAGLDYRLGHFLDLRLIELGAGRGYNTSTLANAPNTSNQISIFTVNSGLVVHF